MPSLRAPSRRTVTKRRATATRAPRGSVLWTTAGLGFRPASSFAMPRYRRHLRPPPATSTCSPRASVWWILAALTSRPANSCAARPHRLRRPRRRRRRRRRAPSRSPRARSHHQGRRALVATAPAKGGAASRGNRAAGAAAGAASACSSRASVSACPSTRTSTRARPVVPAERCRTAPPSVPFERNWSAARGPGDHCQCRGTCVAFPLHFARGARLESA